MIPCIIIDNYASGEFHISISDIVTVITLLAYIITGIVIYKTLIENRKLSYFQVHAIINRHHSEEITNLRREVITRLAAEIETAKQQNKQLKEVNPKFHGCVSSLINYYEGLALFLQGGWTLFPKEMKYTLMSMLRNSVSVTWPLINENKKLIHPSPPEDWMQSYQWLYTQIQKCEGKKRV